MIPGPDSSPGGVPAEPQVARRFKFVGVSPGASEPGETTLAVTLETPSGRQVTGTAVEGTVGSRLRCAAVATIAALESSVGRDVTFDLLGIKAIKAFDTTVVIVAVSAKRADQAQRLVGSSLAPESVEHGAAVAVLNATNRLLGTIRS